MLFNASVCHTFRIPNQFDVSHLKVIDQPEPGIVGRRGCVVLAEMYPIRTTPAVSLVELLTVIHQGA